VIGRAGAASAALALSLLAPAAARANGSFPAVSQLVADPADAEHLVLRTTFGLLVTRDRGANWDWLCEAGAGYKDIEPPMAVLPGGVILLGVTGGVSRSDATGCDFELAQGIDADVYDLARVPAEPDSAVAISGTGTDAQLWRTTDAGKSFSAVGDVIDGFIPATVDVAATDAHVIYASGLAGTTAAFLRSSDGGETFTRFSLPSTMSGRRPFIAAVDPRNADTVYVRFDVQGSSPLAVTHDGGKSWVTPLTTMVSLAGFALSPDGKTVLASNAFDGTFRADADTLVFEKVACSGPTCLSFSDAGLFGCGDQSLDGFIVGRSDDLGASFQRSVDLTCVRGPVACDAATSVGSLCPADWPYVQSQLGATECSPPEVPPNTGCLGEAGAGAVGTTGGTAGAAAAGGNSGSATGALGGKAGHGAPASPDSASSGNCGCRLAGRAPRETPWWLGFLAVWGQRRRRRRRARGA
jgi:photosystem II stability/assembly factor-like uncharacterized protein